MNKKALEFIPYIENRAPTVNDKAEIGALWFDRSTGLMYTLCPELKYEKKIENDCKKKKDVKKKNKNE